MKNKLYTNTDIFQIYGRVLEDVDCVRMHINVPLRTYDHYKALKLMALRRVLDYGEFSETFMLPLSCNFSSETTAQLLTFFRIRELNTSGDSILTEARLSYS
jgi:hypothetical protein